MAETLFDLTHRRAVRAYQDKPVPKELLDKILEAGTYAPTAMGSQRACIVAVTNKAERDRIAELNRQVMDGPGDPFYGAPVVLVVFGDMTWPLGVKDGSLIMGNLLNAAQAVGLGSCWIDRAEPTFQTPEGRALMKKWGVPEGYEGVGNCILGYAAADPEPVPRHEGYVIWAE